MENGFDLVLLTLQKGTVVDKLKEEVVRDVNHLRQVIKICEGIMVIVTHEFEY